MYIISRTTATERAVIPGTQNAGKVMNQASSRQAEKKDGIKTRKQWLQPSAYAK